MVNINNLFNRISEMGLTAKKVSDDTGISTGNLSDWKKGRCFPSAEKLDILASYLDCSVDYLIGRSSTPRTEGNEKEKRLLSAYREQPDVQLAVDRLLGIDVPLHFTTETKLAAFGGSQTTTTTDIYKTADIVSKIEEN